MATSEAEATAAKLAAGPEFGLTDHVNRGHHTITLVGELDLMQATTLETVVRRLCTDGVASVCLDLSGLSFMDSTGIRSLVVSQDLCRAYATEFTVVPGPPLVQQVLRIAGLHDRFPYRADAQSEQAAS
ncbi:MAG TPA: STAS domain-containing protein [Solirubrobacteraceae bacterium]|jgi:anti-anti-sigma factor|nr:STAS domain-containing protein [Solirubrobacteraceae bacterium]